MELISDTRSSPQIPDNVTTLTNGQGFVIVKSCPPISVTLNQHNEICEVEKIENIFISIDKSKLLMEVSKMTDTPIPSSLSENKYKQFLARI